MSKKQQNQAADAPKAEEPATLLDEKKAAETMGENTVQESAGARSGEDFPLPQVTFSTFALSLASSALVQLGEVPNPSDGSTGINLPLAKHTIDILSMLQDKIEHGLDAEEKRLMEGILYELRMKYVIKAK